MKEQNSRLSMKDDVLDLPLAKLRIIWTDPTASNVQ